MKPPIHFLAIEDDDVDVEALTRALAAWTMPYSLTVVKNGRQALDLLIGVDGIPPLRNPYIILLDLDTPGMGGLEFLSELRRDPKIAGSVVFVCSGSNNPQHIQASYAHMVAGYFVKSKLEADRESFVRLLENYYRMVEFPRN